MTLVFWLIGKFVAYCAMALLATRLFSFGRNNPVDFMFRYAALRMVIGILAGFLIVAAMSALPQTSSEVANYLLTFGLFRYFEWLLVLFTMSHFARTSLLSLGPKGQIWVLTGVAVNIVLDQIALHFVIADTKWYC